ncbi:uncharacterized protein LOC136087077 [Hydra vulgaris]|uniref:Uncharacterized protein LOC136087077 n=1 Tax=Hydra vulgaris TaxID=6087 RepID=A0ABM4CUP9_HYDVU
MCLKILSEADITIASLTFDGHLILVWLIILEQIYQLTLVAHTFHIQLQKKPVFIIMDSLHMLKLIRNTYGMLKIIFDCKNEPIKWDYMEKLVAIQEKEGLHLATKITKQHINWYQEKMKVKLAAQTFGQKVAKAT